MQKSIFIEVVSYALLGSFLWHGYKVDYPLAFGSLGVLVLIVLVRLGSGLKNPRL